MTTESRKADHVNICLKKNVKHENSAGFDKYHFTHIALPEINFDDIDTSTIFLGKKIAAPIMISAMTGGHKHSSTINKNLSIAAEKLNIPLSLGSMRAFLEDPFALDSYQIRKYAKTIPILANIGAVQLNYGVTKKQLKNLVDSINGDGLTFHLNPLQEIIQPEGDTNFKDLIQKINSIANSFPYPITVKEVGSGITYPVAKRLQNITYIDTAGTGGTSWAAVEGFRNKNQTSKEIAETFRNWGTKTTDSILECKKAGHRVIASGGITNGLEVAKALTLGSHITGIALPLLKPATISAEAVEEKLLQIIKELKIAMFCTGSKNLQELKAKKLIKKED